MSPAVSSWPSINGKQTMLTPLSKLQMETPLAIPDVECPAALFLFHVTFQKARPSLRPLQTLDPSLLLLQRSKGVP
ncbi:UNVERIFIED_CONTAM: hypothetical protein K2H54_036137 [Gekko kuhli]